MTASGPGRRRRSFAKDIAALSLVGAAVVLRALLDPVMGDALPLVTLFGAVAGAVWFGGYRPAITAALSGYVACAYFFIEPRRQFALASIGDIVGFGAYAFTCALIIAFGEATRRSQVRASEQGELLRVTLRSIGDAVITTDTGGRVETLNAVAESMTGWSSDDAKGQPLERVFRIVNEETKATVESPATRAMRDGVVVGLANHTLLIDRRGIERAIDDSAAPIRDEAGDVSGCVLIFRDVSAQRRLERASVAQLLTARLLASIVESSDDAIISKSLDGVIQSWNAGAERLFGHTAAQAVGRHISLVIPPQRMGEEDHIIASLKAGRRIEHFETERLCADGRLITVSLTISPIKDDAGAVVGASKIVRDVTERRRLEDDLRRAAATLAEADRRKDEFMATLAHELRNPLAPIVNMVEVLKRADHDPATVRRARETIERQLGQLVRLVDDLLDLNRITHNRLELRLTQVELSTVIQHAVEAVRPLLDQTAHQLRVSLPEEPVYLRADPARLAQVFGNLLNNSCKYTPPNGSITIAATRQGGEVLVSVRDSGSGIPADKLQTIFEMFAQVDRSLDQSQGGLGIGLTLVKRFVEMHGGTIQATSAGDGQGSEFTVRLPVMEAADVTTAPGAAPLADVRAPARRILVVDDNEDSALSLTMLLETTGSETRMAHDGVSALAAAETWRPDVVLLDLGLPRISGYDVCRRIREQPWGRELVIIALTGWGQAEDRRRSREAGFDGHLVKPVDYNELVKLLGTLVPAGGERS